MNKVTHKRKDGFFPKFTKGDSSLMQTNQQLRSAIAKDLILPGRRRVKCGCLCARVYLTVAKLCTQLNVLLVMYVVGWRGRE